MNHSFRFKDLIDCPRVLIMVGCYRFANFASRKKRTFLPNLLWAVPVLIMYRFMNEFLLHSEIPASTKIGKGLFIDHGYGIVINKHTVIGDNCRIKHNVTIGCKTMDDGSQGPSPVIGNNVDIGAGALIVGDLTIGDNVKIGAGAIVVSDIPADSIAYNRVHLIIKQFSGQGI